ncbi:MAG TPA: PAS domain S-box protein, partial [Candidatus Acidoferrum sp.]
MSSQALPAPGEELFHYLFAQASLGIAVEDLEGKILLANPVLCSMFGYREDELCGMHCSDFANPEDSEDDLALFQQLCAGAIDRYSLEKRYVRKDGVQIWGRLNVSLWRDVDGEPPLVFAFVEDITDRKLSELALASLSRRLIDAQERERLRISRELHDDIGQRVALLTLELQQLLEDPSEARGVDELRQQAAEIGADIQSLSHELHSAKLQILGIAAAAKSFCQEFETQQKVQIDFRTDDLPAVLPPDISLCFFRILQESLRNAAKHSSVRHFEVRLWGTSSEIHLTVSDSGVGFDRESAKASPGLGLISMEERLRMLNGTFSIESRPQHGTTIHARVPFSSGKDSL